MKSRCYSVRFVIAALAVASGLPAFAQAVLVVSPSGGSGNFSAPQAAIQAAAEGDTILVKPGTYPSFVVNGKSLDIVGDGVGVKMNGGFSVRNLAASQKVMIREVEAIAASLEDSIQIKNNLGPVYLERVRSTGANGFNVVASPLFHPSGTHAVRIINSNVTLVRCELFGGNGSDLVDEISAWFTGAGGTAVWSEVSTVALLGCTGIGGRGGDDWEDSKDGGDGGHGTYAYDGTVIAIGSTLKGGKGGFGGYEVLSGCGYGGDGGAAIFQATAQTHVYHAACALSAGKGGAAGGPPCSKGVSPRAIDGAIFTTLEQPHDLDVGVNEVSIPSPLRVGLPTTVTVHGKGGSAVLLRFSTEFQSKFSLPLSGILVSMQSNVTLFIPELPGTGVLALPLMVPALPVGNLTRRLVIQGWVEQSNRDFVVSTPTIATILDSTL